tara:strand:+ start:32439 stop:32717 length:279 start_codon:yes stop_codon:yes gene_type:complete
MVDFPSSYKAEGTNRAGIQWDDRAFLHATGDGEGVLDQAKAIRSGTFAELVGQVASLPEDKQGEYYIQKAGDREYHAAEIVALAKRDDFPGK